MKKQFAAQGMELLTPVEFLKTEEQTRAYIDFTLPEGGMQKFTKGMLKWMDKNPHASGAAGGFEMIPSHLWMDRDILKALDQLRVALELDALVVLANTTSSNPKSVTLSSVMLQILGPNPDPKPENKMSAKYWTPMIPYPAGTFGKGFKGVPFHLWGKPENTVYDGYTGIISGLATRTLEELRRYLDKGKYIRKRTGDVRFRSHGERGSSRGVE